MGKENKFLLTLIYSTVLRMNCVFYSFSTTSEKHSRGCTPHQGNRNFFILYFFCIETDKVINFMGKNLDSDINVISCTYLYYFQDYKLLVFEL